MKKVLIFSGTTEGRELAERLTARGIFCDVCVATEYGSQVMQERENLRVRTGRLEKEGMYQLMQEDVYLAVVDATHPYAVLVSENIRQSANDAGLPCLRLKRETDLWDTEQLRPGKIFSVKNHAECVKLLQQFPGNILLTTGSKDLHVYTADEKIKSRLYIRVLPGIESIRLCEEQKIAGKQIIAMQGPFSQKLNEALINQYQIRVLVTKASGKNGGFLEKLQAAEHEDIPVIVIENPETVEKLQMPFDCKRLCDRKSAEDKEALKAISYQDVSTVEETAARICQMAGILPERSRIFLVGIGMGNTGLWTEEVRKAVASADCLFGADRLLESVPKAMNPGAVRKPFYRAEDIIPYLKERQNHTPVKRAAILFSGDIGFYSGAKKMYEALNEAVKQGMLAADIESCPGISSISYLSAKTHISWQDAKIVSMHGRPANVLPEILSNPKMFLIVSGCPDINALGELLIAHGLRQVKVTVGYQLSYPEEKIERLSPEECFNLRQEGLYTCIVENPAAAERILTPGRPDGTFIRDRVPMTKEEVREVSICKLRLPAQAVFYDIGSGTGSIAVEAAGLSESITVYAVEKKEQALSLIRENCKKSGLSNVRIVSGEAPEALDGLPVPTHAFIGGSGGNLREIVSSLYRKNPHMRLVINAISLETIAEITKLGSEFPMEQEEIIEMQVSRAKIAGAYHLMQAENPIYIFSCTFTECEKKE